MTYTYLDSVTLGSNASSVTLSNIDQNYGDLVLVIEAVFSNDGRAVYVRFNGDSGNNYNRIDLYANNTSPATGDNTNISTIQVDGYQNVVLMSIFDYAKTDKHKTALYRGSSKSSGFPSVTAGAPRWANTAAITSITVSLNADSLETGSTIYLYGIES